MKSQAEAKNRSMHIALLTPAWPGTFTPNGVTTSISRLREGLRSCGHDVSIITISLDAPHDDDDVFPSPRRSWGLPDKLRWRLGDEDVRHRHAAAGIVSALNEAQRRRHVDVFVMEESFGWAYWIKDKISIPLVVTLRGPWVLHKSMHGGDPAAHARRESREASALQVVQGITAPSRNVLEETRKTYGFPKVPEVVIPNAVPIGPPVSPTAFNADRMRKLFFVGRYDRHKGGDTVLDMFRLLSAQDPRSTLTFVGPDRGISFHDGSLQNINDHTATFPNEIRNKISVLGQRSKPEIEDLRRTHGITLVASRYEVFGNVVIEAMAVGSPIVCTKVGGPAEILRHEETAILVPPDDPKAMAAACKRLLNDPEMAFRLGRAAQDLVREEFQPKVVGGKMAAFLEEVVERHTR